MCKTAGFVASAFLLLSSPLAAQQEVVTAIQVHGNTLTSTEDIIRASGISVGDQVSDEDLSDAEARLSSALKFESVEVLKRFASISDLTRVLILIQVDEGPVRLEMPDIDLPGPDVAVPQVQRPRVVRRSRFSVMFVPILSAEDGYGFTYGAQFAFSGRRSAQRRVVVPASWGGDKRIGVEYQQEFSPRFAPRLRTGAFLQRRTHPFYEENADRTRVWGRTEWSILRDVRAGGEVAWQSSSLAGPEVEARSIGGDVIVDTRVDPLMPHNAIFVRSAVERLYFGSADTAVRTEIDANGYVGLYRGMVVALRAVHENFSRPAPHFLQIDTGGLAQFERLSRRLRRWRHAGGRIRGVAHSHDVAAADGEIRIQHLHGCRHNLRQGAALQRPEAGERGRSRSLGDRSVISLQRSRRARHRFGHARPYRRGSDVLTPDSAR